MGLRDNEWLTTITVLIADYSLLQVIKKVKQYLLLLIDKDSGQYLTFKHRMQWDQFNTLKSHEKAIHMKENLCILVKLVFKAMFD